MTRATVQTVLAFLAGVLAGRRWQPKEMRLSPETLADVARREDRSGLGEVNDSDPHPYAVSSIRTMPSKRRA